MQYRYLTTDSRYSTYQYLSEENTRQRSDQLKPYLHLRRWIHVLTSAVLALAIVEHLAIACFTYSLCQRAIDRRVTLKMEHGSQRKGRRDHGSTLLPQKVPALSKYTVAPSFKQFPSWMALKWQKTSSPTVGAQDRHMQKIEPNELTVAFKEMEAMHLA